MKKYICFIILFLIVCYTVTSTESNLSSHNTNIISFERSMKNFTNITGKFKVINAISKVDFDQKILTELTDDNKELLSEHYAITTLDNKEYLLLKSNVSIANKERILELLIEIGFITNETRFRERIAIPNYILAGTLLCAIGSSISIIGEVMIGVSAYLQNENIITTFEGAIMIATSTIIAGISSVVAIFSVLFFNWDKIQKGEKFSFQKKRTTDILLGFNNKSIITGIAIKI